MNDMELRDIQEAITAADVALTHLEAALGYLKSAKNWGIVDIIGGGLISSLVKHNKIGNAQNEMEAARASLQRFSRELQDVRQHCTIEIGQFLTFADFFFDGLISDIMVQSKVKKAMGQCEDAIRQVHEIRSYLLSLV
ncbi:MAG: hypothetical protein K6G24_00380 [Lachnospiraceae bacterium]|nr:hypothetical protein [Lachnospiraceae bacterium]